MGRIPQLFLTLVVFAGLAMMISSTSTAGGYRKVLLTDITTLTLHSGKYTTGRRGSPVLQTKCVGGTAGGRFRPDIIQCYNKGSDGFDVQWECKATMPTTYQFGRVTVTCEGFDHPSDPFVLAGSCGLEYELESTSKERSTDGDHNYIFYLVILGFAIICVVCIYRGPVIDRSGEDYRPTGPGGPHDFPQGPPPPPYSPGGPPPYPSSPPPSAPDCSTSGPGFWSGAGLGALGGYFMGSQRTAFSESSYNRFSDDVPTSSSGMYHRSPRTSSPSPSSSSYHSSSGFGGTSRR